MYLLYLDDSGSAQNPNEEHLVLGGICLHEHQVQYFTQQLDNIAHRLSPQAPGEVEFHASEIFSGRQAPWKALSKPERIGVIKEVLQVVARSYSTVRLFACAVHKASNHGRDPMEIAFEDLCSRFDKLLWRLKNEGDNQRGLIVLDKSAYETNLQKLAQNFRTLGTRWNVIRNIVDVPLFVDSRKSPCVQVADHVAYSVFRRYEAGDTSYLDIIHGRFDSDGRILHGLSHKQAKDSSCMCSACLSRRSAARIGDLE